MSGDIIPVFSFALVTTFTPGPNNISSASMGILYGYGRSFRYMAGIATGFLLIQVLSMFMSSLLLRELPAAEPVLRIAGAAYILWLAHGTIRASYGFESSGHPPLGFGKGVFLQLLNPKGIVYGMTLYSTFLASFAGQYAMLAIFAVFFSTLSFCSVSTWALCGAAIHNHLRHSKVRVGVNLFLSLLLVYTAVDISGLLS